MKTCQRCNSTKPITDFYKDNSKKDKLTIYCKECCKKAEAIYHKKNPVKKINRVRKSMMFKTGLPITTAEYNDMLLEQNHRCAICNSHMNKPYIDHNHTTQQIRMLLCHHCNTLLGMAREDIEILDNAKEYLRKFS